MAYAHFASDPDRLPWLNDVKQPTRPRSRTPLLLWLIAAAVIVAAGSFWVGMNSSHTGVADVAGERARWGSDTVPLPQASPPISREPVVQPTPMPQVEPAPVPAPVPIADSARQARVQSQASAPAVRPSRSAEAREQASSSRQRGQDRPTAASEDAPKEQAKVTAAPPALWPAWESAGAAGRMVRVGTFSTRHQAKRGWVRIVQGYTGITGLPAVVVASPSLRNGKTYYRLQIGTTSQAHSEILCQRMKAVGQSCVVVGLGNAGARQ